MADRKITGTVVFADTNGGIKDLTVMAFDLDPLTSEEQLGKPAVTDGAGKFTIIYQLNRYNDWTPDRNPDVVVRIHAPGGRLLHATSEVAVSNPDHSIGTVRLHSANVKGWLVTNATLAPENPALRPSGEPLTWTTGNKIEILQDGEALFPDLTDAVEKATNSIRFVNMNFWINDNLITKFSDDPTDPFDPMNPKIGSPVKGQTIHEILKAKAAVSGFQPPEVLVQDVPFVERIPIFNRLVKSVKGIDTADEVKDFFKDSGVRVRLMSILKNFNFPTFMHVKAVVIDSSTAYVLGSTMTQSYFSAKDHLVNDARHSGSLIHDISIKVKGPAVEHVDRTFTTLWNASEPAGPAISHVAGQAAEPGGIGVQVIRTLPGGVFEASHTGGSGLPHGETGALEAYQRAIANATRYIYIEDQYLTAPEIYDAVFARMMDVPKLEVLFVINSKPDVPGYPEKQIRRLNHLQEILTQKLGKAQVEKRLGIYTMWSCNEKAAKYEIMPIYVHSKIAIVDDIWATIGSTNLDGASLNDIELETIFQAGFSEKVAALGIFKKILVGVILAMIWPLVIAIASLIKIRLARSIQHANPQQESQPTRSSELNLMICEKNPDAGVPNMEVVRFREDLWKELLGLATLPVPTDSKGWVQIWDERAKGKLDNLKADSKQAAAARQKHLAQILRWTPKIKPKDYLAAIGLDLGKFRIRDRADAFNFQTGQWKRN